jgi:hypothetical protein
LGWGSAAYLPAAEQSLFAEQPVLRPDANLSAAAEELDSSGLAVS